MRRNTVDGDESGLAVTDGYGNRCCLESKHTTTLTTNHVRTGQIGRGPRAIPRRSARTRGAIVAPRGSTTQRPW